MSGQLQVIQIENLNWQVKNLVELVNSSLIHHYLFSRFFLFFPSHSFLVMLPHSFFFQALVMWESAILFFIRSIWRVPLHWPILASIIKHYHGVPWVNYLLEKLANSFNESNVMQVCRSPLLNQLHHQIHNVNLLIHIFADIWKVSIDETERISDQINVIRL